MRKIAFPEPPPRRSPRKKRKEKLKERKGNFAKLKFVLTLHCKTALFFPTNVTRAHRYRVIGGWEWDLAS